MGAGVAAAFATAIALAVGDAAGFGTYTFAYEKGASYLTDDPAGCAMRPAK